MKHISHNPKSLRTHVFRYNIDFLLYYKFQNFLLAVIGSVLGIIFWYNYLLYYSWTMLLSVNSLYLILVLGGGFWLIITSLIVYKAGNTKFESVRIASRRGLFTFSVMLIVVIASLSLTSKIYWNQHFIYFLKYVMLGMINAAFFAVPLDYGIPALEGYIKKKRHKIIEE
ncbi:MAG: hypothetical protein ACMXYG_01120 [Candidatus Woesearchaeota archaeon]